MKKIFILIALFVANIANSQTTHLVNSGNFYYSPTNLTINVGDTVTWINDNGFHNVNFDINTITGNSFNNPQSFISTPTSNTNMYTHVFTVAGTYNYDCSVGQHAANGMVGSIVVNSNTNTIYDIVSNSTDHTTLKTAIDACALDGVLSGAGPFTLFAPTDGAFNLLPAGTVTALLNDIPQLTNILKHHVVADSVMSGMLSNGQVVTTLLGTDITVTINSSGVFIDNAQVTVADLVADNGVVHVIDAVLLPTYDCNGIAGGTALVDACGDCQQAYIYNFQTNVPTFVDNANILIAGVDYNPATEALIFPDNPNNPLWVSDPTLCPNSIYDIVSNSPDHTTLKTAIDACALDGVLSGAGPFTLFAPTDAAFNLLPAGTITALLNDIPQLTDILKHHVVADSVMSGMLSNGQVVTTLLGTDITVTINSSGVFIDNAQVTVADLVADNGVVHVIDAVLLPPTPPTNTIYDIVSNSQDHTTLKTAIDACELDAVLSGAGPFTLFAPTDAAFNLLPAGTVTALINDIPQLTNILKHHVVADSVMSGMLSNGQVVTTLLGTDITVTINSSGVFIDNAQVTVADLVADNGVVHVIDAVLLPSNTSTYENIGSMDDYLYTVDILGKKVSKNLKYQFLFDVYKNGKIIKKYNR
ncbi:MAG: fasciclin domain-containing protein [Bacteroidota bacterium]|nr:fasciclin domain-containing protein [Bacteroidota bacterium]